MFKILSKPLIPVSRHLRCSSKLKFLSTYKQSTGLVGLAVDPNGKETLASLSEQILESVKKIPEQSGYRTDVEKMFTFIHKTTKSDMEVNYNTIAKVKYY